MANETETLNIKADLMWFAETRFFSDGMAFLIYQPDPARSFDLFLKIIARF